MVHTPQLDVKFSGGFLPLVICASCPLHFALQKDDMSKYVKQVVTVKVWKPEWHPSLQVNTLNSLVSKEMLPLMSCIRRKKV